MRIGQPALKRLAGFVWLAVGTMLAVRGLIMIFGARPDQGRPGLVAIVASLGLALVIGVAKGRYVLSKTARRNLKRITGLAEPRVWNVFTGQFLILILGMIGLGRLLKYLAGLGYLGGYTGVGGIYVGIGMALLVSAMVYFIPPPPPLPTRTDSRPEPRERPLGVLLVNLGTPEAPTTGAVRRYLREFLGDPRVIEVNRALWAFILNVMILPFRSGASARAYREIWTPEGSPLLRYTLGAAEALRVRLVDGFRVVAAMRYGRPGIDSGLDDLLAAGCEHVLVLPLFPQYTNATIGSVHAEVMRLVARRRVQPGLTLVSSYCDHPGYVEAVATRVRESLERHSWASRTKGTVDRYVFSFHGLPEAYVARGDSYVEECARTSWALADALGLARDDWEMIFQSRFGSEPWLQPYLDEYVPELARRGMGRLLVVLPGFTADCLETLEEVDIRLREDFHAAGGEDLIVVPALNDHPAWIDALEDLIRAHRHESRLEVRPASRPSAKASSIVPGRGARS